MVGQEQMSQMKENVGIHEGDTGTLVAKTEWLPFQVATTKGGSEVGIARDDHCFVVLSLDGSGQWHPVKHIPEAAARLVGHLVNQGALDY